MSKSGEIIVGIVLTVCGVLLFVTASKVALAAGWVLVFFGLLLIIFWLAGRAAGRFQNGLARLVFLGPAVILLIVGLVVPAIQTTFLSFQDANSKKFVGLDNYDWVFTTPDNWVFLRNTFFWIVITPIFSTLLGLVLALLMDRMKRESIPKSLIFMPMAISFVGASIIWGLVYEYRDPSIGDQQVGLLSAVVMKFGIDPPNWLLWDPWNNFLLMVIMIWIQTGFALVVLSAAIKAIPVDVTEAAMLDGATGWKLFQKVTVPMIRGTLVVVLTTIAIGVLKVFDIVRTMTNGNFGTQVLANEMYAQSFVQFDKGRGSALAVILFIAVTPLIVYNVVQLRKEQQIR
jgi:alpha-glucoside transport system permease protein